MLYFEPMTRPSSESRPPEFCGALYKKRFTRENKKQLEPIHVHTAAQESPHGNFEDYPYKLPLKEENAVQRNLERF